MQVSVSNETDYLMSMKRGLVMSWACSLGNTDCKEKASDMFGKWLESDDSEHRLH